MSSSRRVVIGFVLIAIAAGARILLQGAGMPPYAGLDEIYHVARVNFVANEGRNPSDTEPSVARYLHASLALEEGSLPDFVQAAPRWREMVRAGNRLPEPRLLSGEERTTYLTPNYQAQQASLYYHVAALVHSSADETALAELRALRLLSAFLAVLAVMGTGLIGWQIAGLRGIAVASLLVLLPTWHTLTVRASNDALAVAALTWAIALSIRGSKKLVVLEALAWAVALATKLYTWPLLVILPILWWRRGATKIRIVVVSVACLLALVGTSQDLRARTGVPVGLGAFDQAVQSAPPGPAMPIAYDEMVRITIASAIWMSGQHNNALSSEGMALYVLPPLFLVGVLLFLAPPPRRDRRWVLISLAAIGSFALAQAFHASAHIRNALLAGESMPAAGKEGWYWLVLMPLLLGLVAAPLFARLRGFLLGIVIVWFFAWDLTITEGALFRDYAGLAGPETPGALFRWGPAPFIRYDAGEKLAGLAAGPLTSAIIPLRVVTLAAVAGLMFTPRAASSAPPQQPENHREEDREQQRRRQRNDAGHVAASEDEVAR